MNLIELAREAGRAGKSWNDFTFEHAEYDCSDDWPAAQEAYEGGIRETRLTTWRPAKALVGREFLPACAVAVLEDPSSATAEYWDWLASQTQAAIDEQAATRDEEREASYDRK